MAKNDKHKGTVRRGEHREPKDQAQPEVPKQRPEHWRQEPDEHDYPAAHDYLTLLLGDADVDHVVKSLKDAALVRRKAKDLLRASRLALLGAENPEVMKDLGKVGMGERLSPVLLVRGALGSDVSMTVADGYHRICASYHLDEDADIPCRIVDPPKGRAAASTTREDGEHRRSASSAARGDGEAS